MKPLDPALAAITSAGPPDAPSLFEMEPHEARSIFDTMLADRPIEVGNDIPFEDCQIPTAFGDLPIRIYRPTEPESRATIVFLHGGGYMLGGIRQMNLEARLLCEKARAVVVSVEYRLAPEHRLPAAHDDAVSALQWINQNASMLGGDETKLCIAGESAGANIAASAAISMRDLRIPLAGQLLIVPAPDFVALREVGNRNDAYPMLSCRDLRAIVKLALPSEEAASSFPYSACYAECLQGLAPAVIAVAGHCPTRKIGESYAELLRAAGNEMRLHCFEDVFHPFFAFADVSEAAMNAVDWLTADFREILLRQ